ncbi:hypothetical protein [Micromonospora sp. CB01531]|uniref:hypothetical protein n=1 Tax=Micromonospora sp. CB01531 TaxID=1718947 RepID=UPI0009F8C9C7|nr:hypothetical protein [Micromonospora sp. CB01531]
MTEGPSAVPPPGRPGPYAAPPAGPPGHPAPPGAPGPYGQPPYPPPSGYAPPPAPPARRSRRGLWIGLGAGVLALALCAGVGVVGLASYLRNDSPST